ncbi:Clp protease N-terminal domain-containing protein [Planomonospora sphaerica]|uniref:Clp protease N-terminal domain-containing protein n=1 Tax=Planomonospora sphaerica TaxID=161355 RepID=UPI00350E3B32
MWRRRKVLRKPLSRLLTENASQVLDLAKEEARSSQHGQVSPEHLLLAIARLDSGIATDVLRELGISPHAVRDEVARHTVHSLRKSAEEITLALRTERTLKLSRHEAARFGNVHIGTEHLLLGVIREGEGSASGPLATLGVNLPRARQAVIRVLVRDARHA